MEPFTGKNTVSTTLVDIHEPDTHIKKNTVKINNFWFYIIATFFAYEKNIFVDCVDTFSTYVDRLNRCRKRVDWVNMFGAFLRAE